MGLSFNSFNMMNTNINCGLSNMYGNNMCFGNMFGMNNMFSNYGFGGSIFGMGYGSSPFTDCNGNTNYGAMAGFAVGNTLMSFANLGINYAISGAGGSSKKEVARELNGELDTCLENIDKKLSEINSNSNADTVKASDLDSLADVQGAEADQKQKQLDYDTKVEYTKLAEEDYADATKDVATKKQKLEQITIPDINSDDYDAKKAAEVAAQKELTDAEKVQKDAYSKLDKAQIAEAEAKTALDKAIQGVKDAKNAVKVISELKKLIIERDNIKREINETILDNADGSNSKHRKAGLVLNKLKLPEDSTDKFTDVSKQDIARLIHLFKNGTDEDKIKYKKLMLNIEESAFNRVASNDQFNARKVIRDWSPENSNI